MLVAVVTCSWSAAFRSVQAMVYDDSYKDLIVTIYFQLLRQNAYKCLQKVAIYGIISSYSVQ